MPQPLLYEYVQDWRYHAMLFRAGHGSRQLASQGRVHQAKQWIFVLALVYAAVASLRHRLWLLFVVSLAALVWRIPHVVALFGLARRATFGLRSSLRSHPQRQIRIEVTDQGLREFDSGVESFAPWSAVRSYFVHRRFVGIELANHLAAYIPGSALSPRSSRLEELVAVLESRGVVKRGLPQGLERDAS